MKPKELATEKISGGRHPEIDAANSALAGAVAEVAQASQALDVIQTAITKAQGVVTAHASATQRLTQLRDQRKALAAAHYLGKGDTAALEASATAIAEAAERAQQLAEQAADAGSAQETLQEHYRAAAVVTAAGRGAARCRFRLLMEALASLNRLYAERIEGALDVYSETLLLAESANYHAAQCGEPPIPTEAGTLSFPAIAIGKFRATNTAGVNAAALEAAKPRLANRLKGWGIDV